MLLLKRVENILDKSGFDYCEYTEWYSGCFDIAARRNFTLFLKILDNVDSFQETQANNLKIIAEDIDATVALVGTHTRREWLKNDVLYERFDIPTFNPSTLENIVVNDSMPMIYRFRGGLFAEIDAEKLKRSREDAGLSQSQLAKSVGVTKKNIYEHERQNKKAMIEAVEKIEKLIGEVAKPLDIQKSYSFEKNKSQDKFELLVSKDLRSIGFDTDFTYQTPFNIVARESKMLVISKADDSRKKIEKSAPFIAQLSSVTRIPAVAITKEELSIDIPSIQEKELRELEKPRDIRKFIK